MSAALSGPTSFARLDANRDVGALVVGGDHPGLAITRSLGRRGIPVYVLDDQRSVSSFSRYATRVVKGVDLSTERNTIDSVLSIGRAYELRNWVLFPTRDETVAAFSRHRAELARFYRVTTPPWKSVRWAWDKKQTYDLARRLNIPCPMTFSPRSEKDLAQFASKLPLAVKPAIKENFFYATGAKAWRAETPAQLRELYLRALRHIPKQEILLQEIIPGDGAHQVSYCAFFRDGNAHSTLMACRARQHPREFGRAATYVETMDVPEIEALATRFLRAIDYYGIVEVEFKQDPRDGQYKLLDVNARAWGFHALGYAAGVDFPYLLFADQLGLHVNSSRGNPGIGWMRALTDVPTAIADIVRGHLSIGSYLKSLRNTRIESVFSKDDPLPSLAEIILLPYYMSKKW